MASVLLPQYVNDEIRINNMIDKQTQNIDLSGLDGVLLLSGGQYEILFEIK